MTHLTPQEEEAMLYLWRLGKGFVKDILEQYSEYRCPAALCFNATANRKCS